MRALRLHGPRDLRVDEVPEPRVVPGTVKIRVGWNGICEFDVRNYLDPVLPDEYLHPVLRTHGPHVQGHEFSGRVVEAAADVRGAPQGAVVAVEPLVFDGSCAACRRGEYNLCENSGFIGLMGGGGGMSEYVVVPADRVHVMPEDVSPTVAALVEPLAVAWHAVGRACLCEGDTVLVVGAGAVGLGVLMAARARGAAHVTVSEASPLRRRVAEELGADLVLDPAETDVVAAVRGSAPLGADVSFETSGTGTEAVATLIGALRKGGRAVTVSEGRPVVLDAAVLASTEIGLVGSFGYGPLDFPEVIEAVGRGVLQPKELITGRLSLEEAREKGYEELIAHGDDHVKILVHP
ncbi:zinc-binding dehydrogenase [Nocardiopsis changdeensis]|uniref:Alcohol dehydrogenase catalytic domain-containing protein n=1 Tax=Nocardiopsis changdeensis TaxID=2831969 RepID=A0ABX8BGC7_9ACTN|nr:MULTISPECIES: alcohol dehydrogenase catalytic domain-containing protein [Nocardiopsis]QUX21129.1 alcohol dehydrogenase catalytic domain-containing protein [Nocardiopsis changdeensis]QYX37058.1 alcohol dehydrogenase catalytic domain-containing protein [Nocardiopsis sp. MT53]